MRALAVALLLLLLAGCGGSPGADAEASGGNPAGAANAQGLRTVTIDSCGEEVEVRVEIADSPEEQATGLMNRTALTEDRGMLFVFPGEEVRSFWMKNTPLPLDLVFIDADKPNNPEYVRWALRLTRPGSVIVVDNVVRGGRVADPDDTDPAVVGTRRVNELLATEPTVDATMIQTVGRGYDGFAMALVTG